MAHFALSLNLPSTNLNSPAYAIKPRDRPLVLDKHTRTAHFLINSQYVQKTAFFKIAVGSMTVAQVYENEGACIRTL